MMWDACLQYQIISFAMLVEAQADTHVAHVITHVKVNKNVLDPVLQRVSI